MPVPDVGVLIRTFNAPGGAAPAPRWSEIEEMVRAAEDAGLRSASFPDHHLWRVDGGTIGFREAFTLAAAAAAITSTIEIGISVVNSPFRNPGWVAKMTDTVDEISGGRFVLGLGAGGGYATDYETLGIPTDHRYGRFAEAIQIIHGLLREGEVDFTGTYYQAPENELTPRGPTERGPRVIVAAKGPKMLALVARYADEWNWYHLRDTPTPEVFAPVMADLEAACADAGRDPATMRKSVDLRIAPGDADEFLAAAGLGGAITGTVEAVAEAISAFGEAGIDEVRAGLIPDGPAEFEFLGEVVQHLGA